MLGVALSITSIRTLASLTFHTTVSVSYFGCPLVSQAVLKHLHWTMSLQTTARPSPHTVFPDGGVFRHGAFTVQPVPVLEDNYSYVSTAPLIAQHCDGKSSNSPRACGMSCLVAVLWCVRS